MQGKFTPRLLSRALHLAADPLMAQIRGSQEADKSFPVVPKRIKTVGRIAMGRFAFCPYSKGLRTKVPVGAEISCYILKQAGYPSMGLEQPRRRAAFS